MGKFRPLTRRSFLARVAGGGVALGAAGLTGCATGPYTGATDSDPFDAVGHGRTPVYGGGGYVSGCSDSDGGVYADPAGRGQRCAVSSGCSDADSGPYADPGGQGRRCGGYEPGYTGFTDADSGPYADRANYGHGRGSGGGRACSDADSGRYADPGGQGVRCGGYEPGYTGITDNDSGSYADRANYGRGGSRSCSDSDSGPWADPAGQGRRC